MPKEKKLIKLGIFLDVKPSSGGMFQYAQTLLKSLSKFDKDKYEIVVAYGGDEWIPILHKLNVTKINLKAIKIGSLISKISMVFFLPSIITKKLAFINPLTKEMLNLNCDIWLFPGQDLQTFHTTGTVIGTIHDLMHRYEGHFPEVSSKFRYYLREYRFKNILKASQVTLVDSIVGKNQVIESYKISEDSIQPLPYIAPQFISRSDERNDFDEYYKLPDKFIFFPAQFWDHKNHLRLIRAIKIVHESHCDISLVLTGKKAHSYNAIMEEIKNLNLQENIFFKDYIPDNDLGGFYKRAKALVYPTFFGPTNIPPLEAIVSGCVPIVSDIYGMKDQLGKLAIYFNPMDEQEIANKIILAWSDDIAFYEIKKRISLENQNDHEKNHFSQLLAIIESTL